jgi:transcriptional regulator with XRE-family HTH domain
MTDRLLAADDIAAIIDRVREELARRRISRQRLAADARISVSTLEKVLSGRRTFTLATLVRLEEALGVALRPQRSGDARARATERPAIAPDELGNYARPSVAWLEGSYLTLVPSFGERTAISAYRTDIQWDDAQACLTFRESERVDKGFSQHGYVSMPNQTGHVYLATNRHGQQRLAILTRPANSGTMHGILATLCAGRGAQLTPAAVPIALMPITAGTNPMFGRISSGHAEYHRYRLVLKKTLDDQFALLFGI